MQNVSVMLLGQQNSAAILSAANALVYSQSMGALIHTAWTATFVHVCPMVLLTQAAKVLEHNTILVILYGLLLQNATVSTTHNVMLVLANVPVQRWLVGGSALIVNQTRMVIQQLAVQLAHVMSEARHCATPPVGSVSVNHSMLESHVINARLMPLMIQWQVASHVSVIKLVASISHALQLDSAIAR